MRWQTLLFAVLSLTVLRMVPVALSLAGAGLRVPTVLFVGWFGPRGLASVVFALIAFESLDSDPAVATVIGVIAATITLSVVVHGISAAPWARRYGAWAQRTRPDDRDPGRRRTGPRAPLLRGVSRRLPCSRGDWSPRPLPLASLLLGGELDLRWAGSDLGRLSRCAHVAPGGTVDLVTGSPRSGAGSRKGNIMNSRTIYAALGTATLAIAGLGTVGTPISASAATAAAAATPGALCQIRVISVEARDIQEDVQGTDEIRLKLGNTRTVQRTYFEGQLRNTLGDGSDLFTAPERVRLLEVDGANEEVVDAVTIPCVNRTDTTRLASADGDTVYRVRWTVDVLIP